MAASPFAWTSPFAWPAPGGPSPTLAHLLVGRRLTRIETQVRLPWGDRASELEWDDGAVLQCSPVPITGHPVERVGLRFALIPADRRRRIVSPHADRRYALGDGSEDQQALSDALVGQLLVGLDTGGVTREGYGVTQWRWESGDRAFVVPMPLPMGWALAWMLLARRHPAERIVLPGRGFLEPR